MTLTDTLSTDKMLEGLRLLNSKPECLAMPEYKRALRTAAHIMLGDLFPDLISTPLFQFISDTQGITGDMREAALTFLEPGTVTLPFYMSLMTEMTYSLKTVPGYYPVYTGTSLFEIIKFEILQDVDNNIKKVSLEKDHSAFFMDLLNKRSNWGHLLFTLGLKPSGLKHPLQIYDYLDPCFVSKTATNTPSYTYVSDFIAAGYFKHIGTSWVNLDPSVLYSKALPSGYLFLTWNAVRRESSKNTMQHPSGEDDVNWRAVSSLLYYNGSKGPDKNKGPEAIRFENFLNGQFYNPTGFFFTHTLIDTLMLDKKGFAYSFSLDEALAYYPVPY